MRLLDWIRNGRNRAVSDKGQTEPLLDAREHGHISIRNLAAEIRHDEGLAKRRDQTGLEPDGDQHVRPEAPADPKIKAAGQPFERGDRIIADEPFLYGGKAKSNPDTPGIVDSVNHDRKTVWYERIGMPPGNVPIASVRHANDRDATKYEKQFEAIEAKTHNRGRGTSWER